MQVKHIRANYSDYFGIITLASYPVILLLLFFFNFVVVAFFHMFRSLFHHHLLIQFFLSFFLEGHPDVIGNYGVATPESYQSDLAYLKSKVISLFHNTVPSTWFRISFINKFRSTETSFELHLLNLNIKKGVHNKVGLLAKTRNSLFFKRMKRKNVGRSRSLLWISCLSFISHHLCFTISCSIWGRF